MARDYYYILHCWGFRQNSKQSGEKIFANNDNGSLSLSDSVQDALIAKVGVDGHKRETLTKGSDSTDHPLSRGVCINDNPVPWLGANFPQPLAKTIGFGCHLGVGLPRVVSQLELGEHPPIGLSFLHRAQDLPCPQTLLVAMLLAGELEQTLHGVDLFWSVLQFILDVLQFE